MAQEITWKSFFIKHWQYLIIGILLVAVGLYFYKYMSVVKLFNSLVDEYNLLASSCNLIK